LGSFRLTAIWKRATKAAGGELQVRAGEKMYSAYWSIRTVAILMFMMMVNLSGTPSFPQAVKFIRHAADPLPLANVSLGRAPCTLDPGSAVAATYATTSVTRDANAPCDTPTVSVPPLNPCDRAAKPVQIGCDAAKDRVQDDLAAMGKTGQKILRARTKVLEILGTENTCSAWLREKDSNPAATFRTLDYAVDRRGEAFVHVSRDTASQYTVQDPYVAKVGQDTGAYATITLNAGGAFFQTQAAALLGSKDEGVSRISGPRLINIGPYPGDSVAGQTLALLHEFGHVLNLLPVDFNNEDGKSVQNTAAVLRFCQAEIESKARRVTLQVLR